MSKARGSPRKFSEKIALLNKKEAEATAEFEKILKEVNETTARTPTQLMLALNHTEQHRHRHFDNHNQNLKQYYGAPQRSSSFSHWQRCPPLQQPQQHLHQNHGHYLKQPMQYNQSNQMQQQPQDPQPTTQDPMFLNQQVQQQQASVYVNSPAQHQDHYQLQQHPQHVQRVPLIQHVTSSCVDVHDESVSQVPFGVPNIEIFRIDDDQTYQQVTSAPIGATDSLTGGHYRYDCSNSSISSARSLPNIANLSVSQTTECFLPQASTDQRLMPTVSTTTPLISATDSNQSSVESMMTNSRQSNNSMTRGYQYNNDEYCSLPAVREPVATAINGTTSDTSRQTQASISRNNSWQSMVSNSAPCSAAPTPPSGVIHTSKDFYNSPQHQQHSPGSTSRQESPQQLLHQDYYPTQQFHPLGQVQRASSSIVINKYPANDLLEAPQIDNNLSKSSEACYGYLQNYEMGNTIDCSGQIQAGSDNYGSTSLNIVNHSSNSLIRSSSGHELSDINQQGLPRKLSNCVNTTPQNFVDTTQYQFYG